MKFRLFLTAFFLMPVAVFAQAEENFEKGAVPQISPDKAYFLIRTREPEDLPAGPLLVRALSPDELIGAMERHKKDPRYKEPPNTVLMDGSIPFAKTGDEKTLLVAAKPGIYILAAEAHVGSNFKDRGIMAVCLCLGTVRFEAKPGVITDMGTLLVARDDKPSPIPELASAVRGKFVDISAVTVVVALKPETDSMPVPESLANLPRVTADYRAQRAFPNYFGVPINRLIAIPGVLDYDDDGHVVDLKTTK
ncbi:MAG TPA: hypothetical protein VJL82_05385 [Rhizomicrobium sp.]|nr:hypothetical protein [Rhizomicrobium sp.]